MSAEAARQNHCPENGVPMEDLSSMEAVEHPVPVDFPEGGMTAWIVVASASTILFCTFGIFQEYYKSHQLAGESPSTISWIGSIQIFFLFAGGLVGGPAFDRYGPMVLWPAVAAYILSIFMTSLCAEVYQFMLAQGILGGIGMGMLNAPSMAAVGQYFHKRRSTAMGIAVAGSSVGGVIFPVILSQMLNLSTLGFGSSIRICGFIILVLLVPATLGIRPRLQPRKARLLLPSAFKEPLFIGIVGSVFAMMIGVFLPLFFLPTYAISNGMSSELAGYLPSILNGASIFGRLIPGIAADKLGCLNIFCAAGTSTAILIFCFPKAHSNAAIITFSALYGFTYGAIVSLMTVALAMVPKSPKDTGTYLGMGMFVIAFGALMGPAVDGAFVSRYDGFSEVSVFCGLMVIVGALGVGATKVAMEKSFSSKL
ncbi:hypothetical protein BP6252_13027 [Coleophoma cylindrospora]|uniref:Major facilitator superfamily (MFS) profile domain-containing protein n=1 Tax=Coleophoma cylindrospora TaxID=1849047 RepID=A0A3D8QE52_9HELO|nr:hypothetical protein BP6252_13027 [Coleophoma cylindrospora]